MLKQLDILIMARNTAEQLYEREYAVVKRQRERFGDDTSIGFADVESLERLETALSRVVELCRLIEEEEKKKGNK